ncbi:MAG: RNA polymerase sigma factor [Candidatus Aquicultor sp.]
MQKLSQAKTILCPFAQVGEDCSLCAQEKCNAFDRATSECLYMTAVRKLGVSQQNQESSDSLLSHGYNFVAIYEKHSKRIYNIAYHILKSKEDAEDISQETFIRAYKSIPAIDPGVPVFSWLCRVATNLCIDKIRKEKSRQPVHIDVFVNTSSMERKMANFFQVMDKDPILEPDERTALMGKIMDHMPPRYWQILMLRVCDGLPAKNVAEILNTTPSAVDTLLFRAKKKFKAIYQQLTLFFLLNLLISYLLDNLAAIAYQML